MSRKLSLLILLLALPLSAQMRTEKPPLHAAHWIAITGKPLSATVGAMIFQKGGNAVDAAAAMIAAGCTMWDTLSWGGETQALIYDPHSKKVIGINALGVAPTGATAEFFKSKGMKYPPEFGPLAAVTPGTPGGIMVMVAEYGKLSLKDVLAPAIQMADGYPIEAQAADAMERQKAMVKQWHYTPSVYLPHSKSGTSTTEPTTQTETGGPTPSQDRPATALVTNSREAPEPGEIFRQPELAATLRKLVEAEQDALKHGKSRKEAIYAAYDRFYKGDIAQEIVRGVREDGGLFTTSDLANWKVRIEEPISTNYKGIDVYKLNVWTQGATMLEALNILENFDLQSMGFNSARYVNTVYQAMSLAFADRDFYYGDPYFPPAEPVKGLLSKDYARDRAKLIDPAKNNPNIGPGDPFKYQGETNPYIDLLKKTYPQAWADGGRAASGRPYEITAVSSLAGVERVSSRPGGGAGGEDVSSRAGGGAGGEGSLRLVQRNETDAAREVADSAPWSDDNPFYRGTTSVEAADEEGWVVSVTPSGGWIPAVIAGHTGIGLSQRMQSFVTDPAENPFNVVEPGKHPRVTLTPTLALKNGKPFLAFAVQGGDSQDQNLLQFFLDVVEFGFTPQMATEAPNINSFQMRSSFGAHVIEPGKILLADQTPPYVRDLLRKMGYAMTFEERTSGPINAILFDQKHGTMWGGSSNHGEDYGIAW